MDIPGLSNFDQSEGTTPKKKASFKSLIREQDAKTKGSEIREEEMMGFWSYFGHLLAIFWANFGHILDIFGFFFGFCVLGGLGIVVFGVCGVWGLGGGKMG